MRPTVCLSVLGLINKKIGCLGQPKFLILNAADTTTIYIIFSDGV